MGAGGRSIEIEAAKKILEKTSGLKLERVLNAYEAGDGSLHWACFHLGKTGTKKLVKTLKDESVRRKLKRADGVELGDYLLKSLERLLNGDVPCNY